MRLKSKSTPLFHCSHVWGAVVVVIVVIAVVYSFYIFFAANYRYAVRATLLLFVYAIVHVFRSLKPRTDCSVSECLLLLLLRFLSHFIWSFEWLGILNMLMIQRHFSTCNWITCSPCKVLHGRQWRSNGYDTTISYSNLDTTFLCTEQINKAS